MNRFYKTELTLSELRLLDGQCSDTTQAVLAWALEDERVSSAIAEAPEAVQQFVCDVVREARTEGRLIFYAKRINYGKYSGAKAGYEPRTRTSRNGRRGEPNYSRPLSLSGVELADRFVTVRGSATLGDTREFFELAKPYLATALEGVEAEIPEAITGHPPLYQKHLERRCTKCEWVGLECDMGRSRTLMGNGTYPSTCPQCGARNTFGSSPIESTGCWKVLPVQERARRELGR